MQKKLSITFNAKRYDIDVDEAFAAYLSQHFQNDFKIEGNNELVTLLQSYVKKCYQLYESEQKLQELLEKLD